MFSDLTKSPKAKSPLVYLVHDARDSAIAQSISHFLLDVNIRTLTATDDGRANRRACSKFGHEWHQEATQRMMEATDVIFLATSLGIDNAELFFEAGIARATCSAELISLRVGIDSGKLERSPFRDFQCFASDADSLSRLAKRLCHIFPGSDRDTAALQRAANEFVARSDGLLSTAHTASPTPSVRKRKARDLEHASAKLFDDLKHMLRDI